VSIRRFLDRFRWPRWGGIAWHTQGWGTETARDVALNIVRAELRSGAARIVVTQNGDDSSIDSEKARPNRTPLGVGLRHWWYRVRRAHYDF